MSALLKQARAERVEQPPLVPHAHATPGRQPRAGAEGAGANRGSRPGACHDGATPALHVLALLEAALACFRLPGAACFGVRAIMLTLFFLALFSKTTLEAAKQLRRWEFGPSSGASEPRW